MTLVVGSKKNLSYLFIRLDVVWIQLKLVKKSYSELLKRWDMRF